MTLFRTPDRARREEFGDVLAEGAFWLLDQGRSVADADDAHWAEFPERRRRFIVYVLDRVKHSGIEAEERARMVTALKAAQGRLARITPRLCRDFMRAWTTDWQRWQGRQPARWRMLRRQEQAGATRPEQVADRVKAFASGNASR